DAAGLDLTVRRFDEAVIIDARKAAQRADQADVRTFRSFDRADTAIGCRVNVAYFKACTFTREAARPKSRKTPLVRNFAQGIRLVHKLAQLRTAEELANRSHNRLGVHQVVRHRRRHLLVHAHLFLDGAFHADEADTELVFEKFANRADAAIAEMVDVIHYADVLAQLQQIFDCRNKVRRIECAVIERRIEAQLDVEFQAAHAAEIVFAGIEKHSAEKIGSRFKRRRVAWAQLAVDFNQRFFRRADGVFVQGARKHYADVVAFRKEHIDFRDPTFGKCLPDFRCQRLIRFEQNFTGLAIDHVGYGIGAFKVLQRRANLRHARLDHFLEEIFV